MEKLLAFFVQHKMASLGVFGGLLAAILLFTIGFWKTVLLFLLVACGLWLGRGLDKGAKLSDMLFATLSRARRIGSAVANYFRNLFS